MPDPICQSIVICEQVIEDKRTNNKSFISVFNGIAAPKVPVVHVRMVIVASLTECHGTQKLAVEMVRLGDDEEKDVLRMEGSIQSPNPLATIDLVFELRGIIFDTFGKYTVRLKALPTGTVLGQRHFAVIQLPQEENQR